MNPRYQQLYSIRLPLDVNEVLYDHMIYKEHARQKFHAKTRLRNKEVEEISEPVLESIAQ
jgi:hypothetical protein